MNKLKLLTLSFLLLSLFTFAQQNDSNKDPQPYIEVTGTAEIVIVPDEIYIGIIIRESYVNKIKVTVEEQDEKLKAVIKSLGIDLSNLYLSDANADYVKVRRRKKDMLTRKDYTLKVADAPTVNSVFQELDKLDIRDAFISRTHHSKMDSLRKEVKIMAIKAAKAKADYLLEAIGEQTGKPLIIKENEIYPSRMYEGEGENSNSNGSRSNSRVTVITETDADDSDIAFKKIKIQTGIYVKFSIK